MAASGSGGGAGKGEGGLEAEEPEGAASALDRSKVDEIERYARSLERIDLSFLVLRDELYGGSWDEVEVDLRARLGGKPFIFKLAETIEESLARIERLRAFEQEHGLDLHLVAKALKARDSAGPGRP